MDDHYGICYPYRQKGSMEETTFSDTPYSQCPYRMVPPSYVNVGL